MSNSTDTSSKPVVLAIGAHPDDLEISCAGTLARLIERDVEVHLAVVTAGECGSYHHKAEEIRAIRLSEAKRAAEILGAASFHHLGMSDQGSEASIQRRRELVNHIRQIKATVLLGHAPGDYHVDHRNAHDLTFAARCAACVPNFADKPPLPRMPHLAFFDNAQGLNFEPHVWIDVSTAMPTRRRMLSAHESQVVLMREMYGSDLIADAETLARARGSQRGCAYAEAFRGCGTFPEPDGAIRFLVQMLG